MTDPTTQAEGLAHAARTAHHIHAACADPSRPRQSIGEMAAHLEATLNDLAARPTGKGEAALREAVARLSDYANHGRIFEEVWRDRFAQRDDIAEILHALSPPQPVAEGADHSPDAGNMVAPTSATGEVERLRAALQSIKVEAERETGNWVHLKRVIALACRAALLAPGGEG